MGTSTMGKTDYTYTPHIPLNLSIIDDSILSKLHSSTDLQILPNDPDSLFTLPLKDLIQKYNNYNDEENIKQWQTKLSYGSICFNFLILVLSILTITICIFNKCYKKKTY